MGIKGIYKEIGTGERIALTKLAVDQLEKTGRPLRLAIDISIWQFQVQAARGGSNPAVRTLFYRLLRLLSLSIHPIFVFDGPNKPAFKRNKRSGRGDGVATAMAKRLIRLFGYQIHDAPGEAEAECALLQLRGIVDAVLSEDVDTIMFGCTKTWRNWSAEGTKGSKTPTHVSVYDTHLLRQGESGLDREGMVLVALMSGGDYIPEGIPGAGVKLACEAARAGFGKSLCLLKRSDSDKLAEWRDELIHQLRTNESKFFRTKHKALTVPEDFPNMEVLRYYTHPVVSPSTKLDQLQSQKWGGSLNVLELREFVAETFDWTYRAGAIKFIRVLAPGLLTRKIMDLSEKHEDQSLDVESLETAETTLVKSITKSRIHFSTDATPELRLNFLPTDIVGYNFEEEPEEEIQSARDGLALNSDDDFEAVADEDGSEGVAKPSRKPYSPNDIDALWTPTTVVKLGIPIMAEDWEEAQRAKASRKKTKAAPKSKAKSDSIQAGALDRYVKVTKSNAALQVKSLEISEKSASTSRGRSPLESLPSLGTQREPSPPPPTLKIPKPQNSRSEATASKQQPKNKKKVQSQPSKPDACVNPWTIAGLQHSPKASRTKKNTDYAAAPAEVISISSSPLASPSSPVRRPLTQEARAANPDFVDPTTSLHKRRPISPLSPSPPRSGFVERPLSPTPRPRQDRRKLARTESMPVSPSVAPPSTLSSTNRRGGLERVQSDVLADQTAQSIDSDDDDALPPLSSFSGRARQNPIAPSSPFFAPPAPASRAAGDIAAPSTTPSPFSNTTTMKPTARSSRTTTSGRKEATKPAGKQQQQTRLNDGVFGMRTTKKVYKPRKSNPGYFREIDAPMDDEAEQEQELSLIDLTNEPDD
ncbi:PIN domain-like protein [Apiospora saccharicola]|uniref:PIN domain-like protein n=1 Tax=Apiospora saccharicola TaxID=335842 RepID=A0ABR1W615_9PEZI